MNIEDKESSGGTITLKVKASDTIRDLKNMVITLTLNLLNFHLWNTPFFFWNSALSILGIYLDENLKLVSQQYRARLDCTDVHAGLALYWWQGQITFDI